MQEIENLLLPLDPHDHPDCQVMYWMNSEISAIKEYAKKCIKPLLEELETLRASNRIRGENIEILKADLAEERKDKTYFKNEFEDLRNSWSNLKAENASLKDAITIAHMDGYAKANDKIRELEAESQPKGDV